MQVGPDTFEELVRRHHAVVYRTARRVCVSDADAADVAQQVFLRVLKGKADLPDQVADAAPALRWLAGRLALNHLRGARRRRAHEEVRAMERQERVDEVVRWDDRRAVRDALDGLPDELRVPLVLRFQEDLTLAGVAGVLGCAESTAHSRVQRALAALRSRLRELGFGAIAARADSVLPGAAEAVAVPAGLEASLLGLTAPAALVGVAGKLAASVAAVALLGVGGWYALVDGAGGGDRVAGPEARTTPAVAANGVVGRAVDALPMADVPPVRTPVAALAPSRSPGPAPQPDPAPQPVADLPTGRIVGRILDPDAGTALGGARVVAASEEAEGKGARFAVDAVTDLTGRFALDVPVAHDGGQAYRLIAKREDHVPFRSGRLVVRAGGVLPPVVAEMRRWAADVEGDWTMDLVIVDSSGQPVAGAVTTVLRHRPNPGIGECHPQEASGQADDFGRVTLRGDHHGEKLLCVRASDADLAAARVALRLDDPGPHRRRIVLEPGLSISGRVVTVDEGEPVEGLWLEAGREDETRRGALTGPDGRFVVRGLGPGVHSLSAWPQRWSPFRVDEVVAGASDVLIRVKAREDARAHGDSLGEIHGRIVDAGSGQPVAVDPFVVRTYWLPPEVVDWRREILPRQLEPAPVQVAMVAQQELGDGEIVDWEPDPESSFHLGGLTGGRYLVLVWSPDHAVGAVGPFPGGPGRISSEVVVALEPGVTVAGTVRDAAGRPVADARVWLGAVDDAAEEERARLAATLRETGGQSHDGRVRTDDEGRFTLDRIPTGVDLRLHAAHARSGHVGSARLVLSRGERRRAVDVVLPGY